MAAVCRPSNICNVYVLYAREVCRGKVVYIRLPVFDANCCCLVGISFGLLRGKSAQCSQESSVPKFFDTHSWCAGSRWHSEITGSENLSRGEDQRFGLHATSRFLPITKGSTSRRKGCIDGNGDRDRALATFERKNGTAQDALKRSS